MATKVEPSLGPKPILFVLTSQGVMGFSRRPTGYYLGEVTHPLAVFDKAQLRVELASIEGGEPPVDGVKLDDPTNSRYWNDEGFRLAIRTTVRLEDVYPKGYSAIYFAGGHGAMWDFPESDAVLHVVRSVYEAGGVIGAVCHGPAALVNVQLTDGSYLVAGRRVSSFTDDEEREVQLDAIVPFLLATRLSQRGAQHLPAPNWTKQVVVDGRLVTGQNPQSAAGVGEAMRDLLLAPRKRASAPEAPPLHA